MVEFHLIWREQMAAAATIRCNFGERAAFDYIVGEKLMTFAAAAEQHPEFARELPAFVGALRQLFPAAIMRDDLARLAQEMDGQATDLEVLLREEKDEDEKDSLAYAIEEAAARRTRLGHLATLLTVENLGTA